MFVKKYFCVNSEYYDPNDNAFNESIHDNAIVPLIYHPMICGYCHTMYPSRNQLFNHLGFLGVDTRPVGAIVLYDTAAEADDEMEHDELGEYGIIRSKYRLKRMLKRRSKVMELNQGLKRKKKENVNLSAELVADALSCLSVE